MSESLNLQSSEVDRGFEPRLGQTEDYKIGICWFSAKHAALRSKSKDWLARSKPLHDNNRKFLHIPFANKGIDAINISNILNRKLLVKEISPYFKNQSVPIVSYSYTNSIGRKIFNYKEALQDINIEEYLKNPLTCDFSHSPFQYNPSGHVITGDLHIIQHESLRKVISHGPKFREPQHINWKHNFKIIMDAVEDYARR